MTEAKPAAVLTSTSGSGNALHIVDDGDGVIFIEAFNGRKRIGVHTTRELIARALRNIGLGVTTLQETEELRARVEEVERAAQDDIKKLEVIQGLASAWELDDEDGELASVAAALQAVLHPAPPYTFPTKYGAVIKAWKDGAIPTRFQYVGTSGAAWISEHGTWWPEEDIRSKYTHFDTITEGIDE